MSQPEFETGLPPWWLVVAALIFAPVLAATPDEWICKVRGHRWGENFRYAAKGKCLRCEKEK